MKKLAGRLALITALCTSLAANAEPLAADTAPEPDAPHAHDPRPATFGEHDQHAKGSEHSQHAEHVGNSSGAASGIDGMAVVDIPTARQQEIGVRTATVEMRSLTQLLRTVGIVTPDERRVRKVQPKISGWVSQLFIDFTGARVSAGQPVLSIYSPDLVAGQREYLLAMEAHRSLPEGSPERELLLESARTRLRYWDFTDDQIRELARSGKPAKSVTLHSPIAGTVTMKSVAQGMYVTPEMELYTVSDLSTVWLWADVYENEIDLVRPDQAATVRFATSPETPRETRVAYISPTVDAGTRTLKVRFDLSNTDERVRPGMYATVDIEAPIGDLLALPEEALIDTGKRKLVFVAETENRFVPREIHTSRRAGGFIAVTAGLRPGERVLVSAQFLIDSESRFRGASSAPAHAGH